MKKGILDRLNVLINDNEPMSEVIVCLDDHLPLSTDLEVKRKVLQTLINIAKGELEYGGDRKGLDVALALTRKDIIDEYMEKPSLGQIEIFEKATKGYFKTLRKNEFHLGAMDQAVAIIEKLPEHAVGHVELAYTLKELSYRSEDPKTSSSLNKAMLEKMTQASSKNCPAPI
jgi:hypothetical protein